MPKPGEASSSTSSGEVSLKFEKDAPEIADAAVDGSAGASAAAALSNSNGGGSSSSGELFLLLFGELRNEMYDCGNLVLSRR